MSIAVLFDCSADSLAEYDQCLELCPELADQPARPYHICMPSGTGFLVIDAPGVPGGVCPLRRELGAVLGQVNLQPTPDVRQIHRIIAREPANTTG